MYASKMREVALSRVVEMLVREGQQATLVSVVRGLCRWHLSVRNRNHRLMRLIRVLGAAEGSHIMGLAMQSLLNWTEAAREYQVSQLCLERISKVHRRCALKILRQIGYRLKDAECCGVISNWKSMMRNEAQSTLSHLKRDQSLLVRKVSSLSDRETAIRDQFQLQMSEFQSSSGDALAELEAELLRLTKLAASQQEENVNLRAQMAEIQMDRNKEASQSGLRAAQAEAQLQVMQADQEKLRMSQQAECDRIREAETALEQWRNHAREQEITVAELRTELEAVGAQNIQAQANSKLESQRGQQLQKALSDAQEQGHNLAQELALSRDAQQQCERHKRCAEELYLELKECRETLMNEKLSSTRALLQAESWKQRSEVSESSGDFESKLLKSEAARQQTEAEWRSKSASWQTLAEQQLSEYKELAENSERLMEGAEAKWRKWAEGSVLTLTQERDLAVQSAEAMQQDKQRVEMELGVTQQSVEVLAELEAHQRTVLAKAAMGFKKVSVRQCVWQWLLKTKNHQLEQSAEERRNAVSHACRVANISLEKQTRALQQARDAECAFACDHANSELAWKVASIAGTMQVSEMKIQAQLLMLQQESRALKEQRSAQRVAVCAHKVCVWSSGCDMLLCKALMHWGKHANQRRLGHQRRGISLLKALSLCTAIQNSKWMVVCCWRIRAQAARELQIVAQLLGDQVVHDPESQDVQTIQRLQNSLQETTQMLKASTESWKNVLIQSGCVAIVQVLSRLRRLLLRATVATWLCVVHSTATQSLGHLNTGSSALGRKPHPSHNERSISTSWYHEASLLQNVRTMVQQVRECQICS